MPDRDSHLEAIYAARFDRGDAARKMDTWSEVCGFLSRWVDPSRPVIDIACDAGYFIRQIEATERWATDVRDMASELPAAINFIQIDGLHLRTSVPNSYFGTVFMSNYLEHLRSSDDVIEQLRVARDILLPGGKLIVLQPNIRLTGAAYWDFIDHHVALTDRSLVEATRLAGLVPTHVIPRFLPYTTKGRLPQRRSLVRLYLRMPFVWRILGGQTLLVAERPAEPQNRPRSADQ